MFYSPAVQNVFWIGQIVLTQVSALLTTDQYPPHFKDMFMVKDQSEIPTVIERFHRELGAFKNGMKLKVFPFVGSSTELVMLAADTTPGKRKKKVVRKKAGQAVKVAAPAGDVPKRRGRRPKWQD
jgi:hypothetical protein